MDVMNAITPFVTRVAHRTKTPTDRLYVLYKDLAEMFNGKEILAKTARRLKIHKIKPVNK